MPTDPMVLQKLDWWQDQKFGLMMHWGTYSQWGVVESWSICSEDQPWCSRNGADYTQYKKDYEALANTFNPQQFNPQPWVDAAKYAGMKYLVFTTKHHDGFCMFDTKQTDYRITGPQVPFHNDPRANVTKVLFNAFRDQGFGIGAYFSKPDWHSPDFWAPEWATPDRCTNYDTNKHPDRWQKFKDYTYNQIEELMSDYGKVDILWLDGGWVRPDSTITEEVRSWGYRIPDYPQDIDMPRIASMARSHQPGLLVADQHQLAVHHRAGCRGQGFEGDVGRGHGPAGGVRAEGADGTHVPVLGQLRGVPGVRDRGVVSRRGGAAVGSRPLRRASPSCGSRTTALPPSAASTPRRRGSRSPTPAPACSSASGADRSSCRRCWKRR